MRVTGYVRVSSDEQAETRNGLEAQRAAIETEAQRHGWELVEVIEDAGYSAKDLKRPGVQAALETLARGESDALVVAKLDRLSRSMLDFASIMATAQKQSWGVVALDVNVDTTTPAGEMITNVLVTFAQFERRLISQRTREALAAKKARGDKLGRRSALPTEVLERIDRARQAGQSLRAIADELNRDGIPTGQGGTTWRHSAVAAVLKREQVTA